ncbi:MAG: cob(I)yrinic acid a,c-diamide adenosyltransferase [Acidimicrobiia bacterium]|nr:cob(I)yrinic acid a,c-diamide adenosyltransferase [Acidimicrobiia bacterium]NNF69936.1 cob(I)yrinic acid a,c-diamide adenosyltransferase [Acidimicrobiia bacterium]NNK92136.1 cob(I)yrinic acid a,c-diamide adenosyltransferase [Acidimicrobiia bacterium]
MKIYTKTGDDGTTGLFYGGRVSKDDAGPEAYGTVDEAVAALGAARAEAGREPLGEKPGTDHEEIAGILLDVQRELFVVGAELATAIDNRHKLEPGVALVTPEMTTRLEGMIDDIEANVGMPTGFVVPGGSPLAATIDVARTVVRRAERRAIAAAAPDSEVVPYLNRLADFLYMLARATEAEWVPSRNKEE